MGEILDGKVTVITRDAGSGCSATGGGLWNIVPIQQSIRGLNKGNTVNTEMLTEFEPYEPVKKRILPYRTHREV